jgi:hypothetical protein
MFGKVQLVIGLTSVFVAAIPINADPPKPLPPQRTVTIVGVVECKDWVEDRARALKPTSAWSDVSEMGHVRWILGYLSALSVIKESERDALLGVDGDLVSDWMDKYCRKHPKGNGADAASALFAVLSKK